MAQPVKPLAFPHPGWPATRPKPRRTLKQRLRRALWWLLGLVLACVLPFVVFVRASVWAYLNTSAGAWGGLALGTLGSVVLLVGFTVLLFRKRLVVRFMLRWAPLLIVIYGSFALLFVSVENVKSPALQETYRALHPILRLGVSTLILLDRDLVITDTSRAPDDYVQMGLTVRRRSLHYPQVTGYVHAVDLRTQGRTSSRNALVAAYFKAMGFQTLRHVGTADHLHVWLPVNAP